MCTSTTLHREPLHTQYSVCTMYYGHRTMLYIVHRTEYIVRVYRATILTRCVVHPEPHTLPLSCSHSAYARCTRVLCTYTSMYMYDVHVLCSSSTSYEYKVGLVLRCICTMYCGMYRSIGYALYALHSTMYEYDVRVHRVR